MLEDVRYEDMDAETVQKNHVIKPAVTLYREDNGSYTLTVNTVFASLDADIQRYMIRKCGEFMIEAADRMGFEKKDLTQEDMEHNDSAS